MTYERRSVMERKSPPLEFRPFPGDGQKEDAPRTIPQKQLRVRRVGHPAHGSGWYGSDDGDVDLGLGILGPAVERRGKCDCEPPGQNA